jgi:hypothetical protein
MEDPTQEEARKQRAFKAFQDAARNKEKDPETFEAARMRYYFLTKGPAWFKQEKKRISSEKIDPILADYRDMYTTLQAEEEIQRGYTDSIEVIKNKQETIKDSTVKQTSFFDKLLDTEKMKKSAYDRYIELTSPSAVGVAGSTPDVPSIVQYFASFPSTFKIILDVVLGIIILAILYLGLMKAKIGTNSLFNARKASQLPSSGITIINSPVPSSFGSTR